jgi:streptogramin lyase
MTLWERLDEEFSRYPVLVARGAPDDAIRRAEAALGLAFSEPYREFLRRYGGAIVGSAAVHGLACAEAMGNESVVDLTARFRRDRWPGTEDWYIVSFDGAGNPVGLDERGEVWLSDHDTREIVRLASSFEEFLELRLRGA